MLKAVKFKNEITSMTIELPLEVMDISNILELPLSNSEEHWVVMTQSELTNYFDKIRLRDEPVGDVDLFFVQQARQRTYGVKLSAKLVNLMGARNLEFAATGYGNVNVAALLGQLFSIKSLIETGALKTARSSMIAVKPNFVNYQDIIEIAINDITVFLTENGYE